METKIFDGKAAAAKILEELKKEAQEKGLEPRLAVLLVGDNPGSLSYIRQKQKACASLGWGFELHQLPEASTFEDVKSQLLNVNGQRFLDGIILQLPLPSSLQIPSYELTTFILPAKDIDGLNPQSPFTPPTALAVQHVLDTEKIKIEGAQAVVLGRGATSGKPIADLLFKRGAKVYVAHSQSQPSDVSRQLSAADIVVACVGRPNLVTGEMIKEGSVVIGVGMSRLPDLRHPEVSGPKDLISNFPPPPSKVVGDIDEPSLMGKARLITPTPGGIGPLTVAFLLKNLLKASESSF